MPFARTFLQRKRRQAGLTLVELLIALFIFALLSSAGVVALRLAVDSREQLGETDDRVEQWQYARLIIKQDLLQATPRLVRDEFGERQRSVMIGGFGFSERAPIAGETPLVGFVRGGWANPQANDPRSNLQYIEYIALDDQLIRRVRPFLDDARDQPEHDETLLSDVSNIEIGFLIGETSRGLEWTPDWPLPDSTSANRLPLALQIKLVDRRFGEVDQLFWIGDISASGGETG